MATIQAENPTTRPAGRVAITKSGSSSSCGATSDPVNGVVSVAPGPDAGCRLNGSVAEGGQGGLW